MLSAAQGTIHYTRDGSDPRDPGGTISAGAIQYTGQPVVLHQNTQVFARSFQSVTGLDGWSGPSSATFTVLPGDFNGNGLHDPDDIYRLFAKLGSHDLVFDLDNNGDVDQADVDYLVQTILDTRYGDTDLDGDVDTGDLTRAIINFTGARADGQSTVGRRVITGQLSTREVASRMNDLSITKRAAKRTTVNDQHVPLTIPTHAAHLTRVLADGATRKQVSTHTSFFSIRSELFASVGSARPGILDV